jgi:hypothetical protein
MTPKSRPRDLGSPDRLFFDDPEKVHHFLGFSPNTLKAWESKGLKIHTWTINKRPIKGVIVSEFWAWFDLFEKKEHITEVKEVA